MLPVISPLFAIVPALALRTDRRIVKELRNAGAVTPQAAIPLDGRRLRGVRIKRLTRAGCLHPVDGDRYYLDVEGWEILRTKRRRRILIAASLGVLIAAVLFLSK